MSQLDSLSKMSVVVADTANFDLLQKWQPQDATTNPSLVLAGSKNQTSQFLVDTAIRRAIKASQNPNANFGTILDLTMEFLLVEFGKEILKRIPGRVSVEVDARLSFNTIASVRKALSIVAKFEADGIPRSRLYIKLASTWEGIKAAEILEKKHGICCNLTLLFSFAQAVACCQAGVSLISPFVGRILDWYKKKNPKVTYTSETDPGVLSVRAIYNYYKKYGYETTVMAASFRNVGEIVALAGCDKITISPALLDQLQKTPGELERFLSRENVLANKDDIEPKWPMMSRANFETAHNEDAMAVEKLSEGIRNFSKDTVTLEHMIAKRIMMIRSGSKL